MKERCPMKNTDRLGCRRLIRNTLCVTIGLIFLLCIYCFVRPLCSSGLSMLPTVQDKQFLAVLPRDFNPFLELERGDVVIVRCKEKHIFLIKRLIAQPGDTLEIRSNQVYVNGEQLSEPYLYDNMITQDVAPFTLGEDMYYVLGDNRNVSADSRYYGLFSGADIYAIVDMENQVLLWILLIALLANVFLWIAYLPDWDEPVVKGSDT